MEPRADLEQAGDPAADADAAFGGLGDAAEDLQQGALPGSVAADDGYDFAVADFEGDIPQGPEFLDLVALNDLLTAEDVPSLAGEIAGVPCENIAQGGVFLPGGALVAYKVALAEILDANDG